MSRKIGIIDEPIRESSLDHLDISIHADSLIEFIKETDTPITIGIQGEWGSGKTSLINSIYSALNEGEDDKKKKFKQIWINSWEYSLLSSPEESLMKIVSKIIKELTEADKGVKTAENVGNAAKKVFEGALRIGASAVGGKSGLAVAEELFNQTDKSITGLRKDLSKLVGEIKSSDKQMFEKVIVYVDDLDRIEPKNAVAILELLKNIFNVKNCVFILAIDYQVVVKGLEHKFGKQTPENEWEFRAFFDKIIQLPFMMPMGQYNIGKYVNGLLIDIGFVDGDGLDDSSIKEIIMRTIGGNPRAIKRLVNSVSLIQIFSEKKSDSLSDDVESEDISEEQAKFLLFSLLCLQIAYPYIYSLLIEKPNFTEWDEKFANSKTMKKELNKEKYPQFDQDFDNATSDNKDFDEKWEQALFKICYVRPRMKERVEDISKFFSHIKDELLGDEKESIETSIAHALSQTSVTSVQSTDTSQSAIPERVGKGIARMLDDIEVWVQKEELENDTQGGVDRIPMVKSIYSDLSEQYKDAEWTFSGPVSGKINGKKFITIYNNKKPYTTITLCRHFDNEYKLPKIGKLKTKCYDIFNDEKSTFKLSEDYTIILKNTNDYTENKDILNNWISKAYDMVKNHDDKFLKLELKNGGKVCSGTLFINNELVDTKGSRDEVRKLALKYLNDDYRE